MAVGFAFLVLVASSIATAFLARSAWRQPSKARIAALIALILFTGFNAWRFNFEVHYFDGVDLNPTFTKEELVGTWMRGQERLTLRADGTFALSGAPGGAWTTGSMFSLALDGAEWEVFRRNGALRIFPRGDKVDPDEWNLLYVFERQP